MVLDNAKTNDVLVGALSRILMQKFGIQWVPENSQIRCLAHVVNLVVQKILAVLNEADDPEIVDYYLPNKDLPFHYDPDGDPDLRDLEEEIFDLRRGDLQTFVLEKLLYIVVNGVCHTNPGKQKCLPFSYPRYRTCHSS